MVAVETTELSTNSLQLNSILQGIITVRIGIRSSAPRSGRQFNVSFIPDEGYAVFKAKVM